ncbi:MAG: pilin [Candidatus Magasanikbacteria bacterium]|nr:pilin [Candidatus Magasanikbacteria bacterium]
MFFVTLVFLPNIVLAQGTPETNPLCWGREYCKVILEENKLNWNEKSSFLEGGPSGICGSTLGACIPAGPADAQITIGGKVQFADLGDYIKTVYLWVVGVGGTIAVVLVMVGGFAYMTSAGSPEKIKDAKGRISSALMGLVIILGSYTLLYTINPDLVNLRLPRSYMLRPVILSSLFCMGNKEGLVAYGGTAVFDNKLNVIKAGVPFSSLKDTDFTINLTSFLSAKNTGGGQSSIVVKAPVEKNSPKCGWAYYLKTANGDACMGDLCPTEGDGGFLSPEDNYPQVCSSEDGELYSCVKGIISGVVRGSEQKWKFPWVYNKGSIGPIDLYLACNDGESYKSSFTLENKENSSKKIISYRMEASVADLNNIETKCSSHGGVKGYFLLTLTQGLGLLKPDFIFILGKNGPTSCNLDLSHTSQTLINWLSNDFVTKLDSNSLIKPEELRQGLICNIDTAALAISF